MHALASTSRPALAGRLGHARPRGVRASPVVRAAAPLPPRRRRLPSPVASTEGGEGAVDDWWKVLGVPPDADSDTVNRAYNRKKYEARGNDAAMARLEAAHSAVVMAALSARLAGGPSAVEPSARWADAGELFPWRPRWAPAERQTLLLSAAVQAALMVYALVSPGTGTQPVVYTALAGAIGNVVKLNALFPPGTAEAGEELSSAQKVRGAKNVGRGLLLAVVATFAGCALAYSFPDAVASALGRSMPYWFYESEKLLLAAGSAIANWVITGFFR